MDPWLQVARIIRAHVASAEFHARYSEEKKGGCTGDFKGEYCGGSEGDARS